MNKIRTQLLLTAAALVALTTTSVYAADLNRPVYKAPPPQPAAPVLSWNSCYVGLNAGATWANNDVDVTSTNVFINTPTLSTLGAEYGPAAAAATTGSLSGNQHAEFIGGGQIGCNWQFSGNWVAGIETDFQGVSQNGNNESLTQTVARPGFPGDDVVGTISSTQKLDYIGTVRPRIGPLITPAWWVYATGGFAYGKVSSDTTVSGSEQPNTGSTPFATSGSESDTRGGWTVGGGTEWMFAPNWSLKLEYLYYDLGHVSYSNGQEVAFLSGTSTLNFINNSTTDVHFRGNIVRAGVNFHF